MTSSQTSLRILIVVVVVACLARLVNLNADPSVPTWIGYVIDEGRWNEIARNLALFGAPEGTSNARLHLFLTPGYQAVNYVVFRLLGIDFWSARLFSALCGILTVVVVFFALRRHVTTFALALGLLILGFETDVLSESRMAIPEMASVLFTLLAFLMLVFRPKTPSNAFGAGVVAAIGVAMKATTILVIPAFPLIILLAPQGGATRDRVIRMLAFVGAIVLLAVGGLAIVLGPFSPEEVGRSSGRLLNFLALSTPYTTLIRFFDSSELEARNLLLLGVWFCSWLWFHRSPSAPPVTIELYVASGVWALWWLIAWSGSQYLPGRYVVHWIVPATIHLMAGLSLADRDTFARMAATIGQRTGWPQALLLAWLVLPSSIFVAGVTSGLAELAGWDISSLTQHIALIIVLTGLLVIAIRWRASHPDVIAAFFLFPVMMMLLWLAARELGFVTDFWKFDTPMTIGLWTTAVVLAFAACFALARLPVDTLRLRMMKAVVLAAFAAIFFAQGAPAILWPSYSIRNASLALQERYSANSEVRTFAAESLFLANKLKFRAVAPGETHYDGIVVFEHGLQSRNFLASKRAADLVQVETYPMTVNPRYPMDEEKFGPARIGIYQPR